MFIIVRLDATICYMSLFPILIPDRLLVEYSVMVVVVELVVECLVEELEDGTILSRQSV